MMTKKEEYTPDPKINKPIQLSTLQMSSLPEYKFEKPGELYYFPEGKSLPYRVYVPKPGKKPGEGGLVDRLTLIYYQICVTVGFYSLNSTESAILQIVFSILLIFTLRYSALCLLYFIKLLL